MKIPIYIRITINGIEEELSLAYKVLAKDWDREIKMVKSTDPQYKVVNEKIGQAKADLERHFDLMQVKHGIVTPSLVKESYRTPVNCQQLQMQKVQNLAFSEQLDSLIDDYIRYSEKVRKAYEFDAIPSHEKQLLLNQQKEGLGKQIETIVRQANAIFDNKRHQKTFILVINGYLLNFLQLVFSRHRSPNSLEKLNGRKRRYIDFIIYRYKLADLPLEQLEFRFV